MSSSFDGRPPTLFALPSYLAANVSRIGHRLLEDVLEGDQLEVPQFAVLSAIDDFGPLAQFELADRLNLNRSHLVGYIDGLEERKLVRRERDPGDRRRQIVSLTATGSRFLRPLQELIRRSQVELLQALSEKERATLIELLQRVVTADDERRRRAETDGDD